MSPARGIELFQGVRFETVDDRESSGEVCLVTDNHIDWRLHARVYNDRGDVRRIISSRKANARENARFDRQN
jgi:uncharacterized DUF497 family protein